MLLAHREIVELLSEGVVERVPDIENVNGSSLDITLGATIRIEERPVLVCPSCRQPALDAGRKQKNMMYSHCYASEIKICSRCGHASTLQAWVPPVDLAKKQTPATTERTCSGPDGFVLYPGQVCLGQSAEVFNLPNDITAVYALKSSMARSFLEHFNAGYCDAGWTGSTLTLEFANLTQHHPLQLREGMKCGQMRFHRHEAVPDDQSYAVRGQYNHQKEATASKGLK